MRILHVIPSLDPSQGGPPAVVVRLAAAQAALGNDVAIVTYDVPAAKDRINKAVANIPGFSRVKVHFLPPASRLERITAVNARRAIDRLMAEHDVAHLHGVWSPVLKAASLAARRRHVPYVVRPCGMLDAWCLDQKRLKKKIALALGYRAMLTYAGAIHTLNAHEAASVRDLELGTQVRIIPNGVFLEELEPLPERGTFYKMHPELQGDPFVLFLSRLHYKKGLDYLADAFAIVAKQHPKLRLVVAGPDEGAQDDFEARIESAGLSQRVHIVGPKYGAEKLAALVDAMCFCLPSRQEGFSVAITEAIACGTPVVVSDECHFPEVAESGAGEVVPLDAKATAAAIDRVLSNPAVRAAMSVAGRTIARDRYTWPAIARQTLDLYATLSDAGVRLG